MVIQFITLGLLLCESVLSGVSGLSKTGDVPQRPTVATYPDHLWEELYKFRIQLDILRKENQELKNNQSELRSQISQKHNMSAFSSMDIQQLRGQMKVLKMENSEIKMNQSAMYREIEKLYVQNRELEGNETVLQTGITKLDLENKELKKNLTDLRNTQRNVSDANENCETNYLA